MSSPPAQVVVVGSCIIDITAVVPKFPLVGESLVSSTVVTQVGGKGSNQAIAVSRLQLPVTFVARVGKDLWADIAFDLWREENVDTRFVVRDPIRNTGMGIVIVGQGGQNITISHPGAGSYLAAEDFAPVLTQLTAGASLLMHLNAPTSTVTFVLMNARKKGLKTILDISPVGELPSEIFPLVDIAVLNEFEAAQMFGKEVTGVGSASDAANRILEYGAGAAIVTLSSKGLIVALPEGSFHVPAFSVTAIDSTAAGDAFCAALCVQFTSEGDLLEAARFAAAAAALAVTRFGTWQSLPTRQEVTTFMHEHPAEALPRRID